MAQEETIENNKLIAEFMGGEFANHNCQPTAYWEFWKDEPPSNAPYIFNRHLKYHTSWDWLMPVVEKVTSLTKEKRYIPPGKYLEYKEQRDKYDEQWEKLFDYQAYNFFSGEIKSIYQAIVEFIKWYNSNKDDNG